ncbi:hypothetical protein K9U40_02575 [Xanthobacter autotrophicus]|uniref:hypothetical protein n=1 Tax=Xanthobacter autotrophicus TaxID=280 RepID=UPI0024AB99A2|nr:hypothetical protein [Xanthobacter autotrophicus]MDI4663230.1 hypothetical protein [Xanthobacter autotrophicus]
MNKTALCILFDTTERSDGQNALARETMARVADLFAGKADLVAVIHSDEPVETPLFCDGAQLRLSTSDIFDAFPHRKGRSIIPGNLDLKMIVAVERFPQYSHFIRWEDDVWPNNPSSETIDRLCTLATSGSVGAVQVRAKSQDNAHWMWWPSLSAPEAEPLPEAPHAALLPLMFFPRSFIDTYRRKLEAGWTGHYEVLMPTIAKMADFTLIDLSTSTYGMVNQRDFNAIFEQRSPFPSSAFVHPVKTKRQLPGWASMLFSDAVHASPAEIEAIAKRMSASHRYIEYGSGGSTALAFECGIQTVFSIETDLSFCENIIEKYALRKYIDVGRLNIRHINIGRTTAWGFPLLKPSERQVREYLSWPSRSGDFDLALIDGRYRIAAAAACYIASPSATFMIHDYTSRPQYRIVEEFLEKSIVIEELAVFSGRADQFDRATEILESFIDDPQ